MTFARVAQFSANLIAGETILAGFAAPEAPVGFCEIELWSAGYCVAAVDAVHYSAEAAAENLRFGWCGFSIELTPELFALDNLIELKCSAGKDCLMSLSFDEVFDAARDAAAAAPPQSCDLDVFLAIKDDPLEIPVLAGTIYRVSARSGGHAALQALYGFLLGREVDNSAIHHYLKLASSAAGLQQVIEDIVNSEEYKRIPGHRRNTRLFGEATPLVLYYGDDEIFDRIEGAETAKHREAGRDVPAPEPRPETPKAMVNEFEMVIDRVNRQDLRQQNFLLATAFSLAQDEPTLANLGLARWLRHIYHLHRARQFSRAKKWKNGANHYAALVRNGSITPKAWVQYGHMLNEQGLLKAAANAYSVGAELMPENADAKWHYETSLARLAAG